MGNNLDDLLNIARNIFEGTKYHASDADIHNLTRNMLLAKERGLSKLNQRLSDGGRKIRDTFSEHNFASMLIVRHGGEIPISYEPKEKLQRPLDFKIVIGKLTYWVQMKRLSDLERENRQNNIIRKIKIATQKIKLGLFFGCELSDQFSESDLDDFINFNAKSASELIKDKEYLFPDDKNPKAKVEFWKPNKSKILYLTLGTCGDFDMVDVTGLAKRQIQQSLINAAGAFEWDVDQYTINLVALDADHQEDIDLCDAIFGTEFEIFLDNKHSWSRKSDGFFNLPTFSNKVTGVITMKRIEEKPISMCRIMLFINRLDDLNRLLSYDKVIQFDMRPSMGNGDFDVTQSSIMNN